MNDNCRDCGRKNCICKSAPKMQAFAPMEEMAKVATSKEKLDHDEVVENLVALVGQLSHALKKANPANGIPARAMSYVESIRYRFSPNREVRRG